MARPDNMTTTTPVDPDGCICPTTYGAVEAICAVHGKWPNRHTEDPRVAELAETCRVLTELAQQLTNAAHRTATLAAIHHDLKSELREALDVAAELGITPQDQP